MLIIAHRANVAGPSRAENSAVAIDLCGRSRWGIELDIRRDSRGRFYFSHDPDPSETVRDEGERILRLLAGSAIPMAALNMKELGYERALLDVLAEYQLLTRVFIFDMELIESDAGRTAKLFKTLRPDVRVAVRVSDRGEPVSRALVSTDCQVVWLDEFDALWAREVDVQRLKEAGKAVFAVSPELHGFGVRDRDRRWREFAAWGVDGICTDYPRDLQAALATAERYEVNR